MDLRDIFRTLDPPAQQWLWTQEPDNSVSPANLDSSISFAVRDEKVDGQRQEMLIVPQVVEDNYVLGSVFGTISRDIQIGQSSRVLTTESTCRRFCVDLRSGEMLQALWFPSDRVSFARHLVKRDGDWFNEIFSLESPQSEQQRTTMSTVSVSRSFRDCAFCVARRTPCACDDNLRMRTFASARERSFGNWMDWASYFVAAGNGTFRTHVSQKSGGQKGNIWWSCAAALGDDCTAMMQKRQVVNALCDRSYKLGIQSNTEHALMSKASRQLLPPVGGDESENSDGSPSLVSVWDEERHSATPVRQHLKRQYRELVAGFGESTASNTTTESLNSFPSAGRSRKRSSADEGDGRHVPNEQTQVARDSSWWHDEQACDAVISALQSEPQPRRKRLKAAIV